MRNNVRVDDEIRQQHTLKIESGTQWISNAKNKSKIFLKKKRRRQVVECGIEKNLRVSARSGRISLGGPSGSEVEVQMVLTLPSLSAFYIESVRTRCTGRSRIAKKIRLFFFFLQSLNQSKKKFFKKMFRILFTLLLIRNLKSWEKETALGN